MRLRQSEVRENQLIFDRDCRNECEGGVSTRLGAEISNLEELQLGQAQDWQRFWHATRHFYDVQILISAIIHNRDLTKAAG